jgi:hypothetical protein
MPFRHLLVLLPLFTAGCALSAQDADSIEVRVFGAEGVDEATALWVDELGCILAGETTSDITMATGQAAWAPGGPVGRKGFVTVLDTALNHQWSFAFPGDPTAPLGAPSTLRVNDVVRTADSTVWVLYDAPREGQWRGHLMGLRPDDGPVVEYDLGSGGATSVCDVVPVGQGAHLIIGNRWPDQVPALVPEGIMVGYWSGQADDAPGWAPIEGTEGMEAVAAGWRNGTLYIASHRPEFPAAPAAVLLVQTTGGNPQLTATAAIADPDLVLTDLTASPQGVAWSGTQTSDDGTLDAAFGKLSNTPPDASPEQWLHEWMVVTESAADRPGRAILWTQDILQCAGRTTTEGAGGSGAMVQRRFGQTGAWFGVHTFGGEADEDVRALGYDSQGRLYVAGSTNSWTDLTSGNGSADAVLFRSTTTALDPGLPYTEAQPLVQVSQTFVAVAESASLFNASQRQGTSVQMIPAGGRIPVEQGDEWVLYDLIGKEVARGVGPTTTVHTSGWLRLTKDTGAGRSDLWLWVRE